MGHPAVRDPHGAEPVSPLHGTASETSRNDDIINSLHWVAAFNHCCKETGFFMVFKCREENAALKDCLTMHYKDPAFFEECKQEYLREKEEFERTGIAKKNRTQKLPTSM
ncbi:hypothetical protein JZ751_007363 [Albula glossodonta]|uniref:COX assembly mitochondrial protein n=1 Tax=Albula glossodonta TaxID=121402 RepID=A0A8T2N3Z2_9TELE|nr:hypothetical protein JZ751_007363 [Albula glossodonta]